MANRRRKSSPLPFCQQASCVRSLEAACTARRKPLEPGTLRKIANTQVCHRTSKIKPSIVLQPVFRAQLCVIDPLTARTLCSSVSPLECSLTQIIRLLQLPPQGQQPSHLARHVLCSPAERMGFVWRDLQQIQSPQAYCSNCRHLHPGTHFGNIVGSDTKYSEALPLGAIRTTSQQTSQANPRQATRQQK